MRIQHIVIALLGAAAVSFALAAGADVADPGDEGDDDAPECECAAVGAPGGPPGGSLLATLLLS